MNLGLHAKRKELRTSTPSSSLLSSYCTLRLQALRRILSSFYVIRLDTPATDYQLLFQSRIVLQVDCRLLLQPTQPCPRPTVFDLFRDQQEGRPSEHDPRRRHGFAPSINPIDRKRTSTPQLQLISQTRAFNKVQARDIPDAVVSRFLAAKQHHAELSLRCIAIHLLSPHLYDQTRLRKSQLDPLGSRPDSFFLICLEMANVSTSYSF